MKKFLLSLATIATAFVSASAFSVQGGDKFELVTNVTDLTDDGTYILAYETNVMGALSGKYFSRVANGITLAGNTATITDNAANSILAFKIVTGTVAGTYSFNIGTESQPSYIANTSSSNNNMATNATLAAKCDAKISISAEGVATISFPTPNGNSTSDKNQFQYNSNSNQERFSNYQGATQKNCSIYKYVVDQSGLPSPQLTFPESSYTVELGGTFDSPKATSKSDGAITYTSSETSVADVDATSGVVTIKAAGTTIITAKIAETASYAAGSTAYTLNVTPAGILSVSEALALIEGGFNGEATVKGYITKIDEISTSYGNATYWIADNKNDAQGSWLEVFRGYSLNGEKFTKEDEIAIGGEVTVQGTILNYNGTYEFTTGSKILSYTAPEEGGGEEPNYKTAVFNFSDPTTLSPSVTPAEAGTQGGSGNGVDVDGMLFTAGDVTLRVGEKVGSTAARIFTSAAASSYGAIDFRMYTGELITIGVDEKEYHIISIEFTKAGGNFDMTPSSGTLNKNGNNATWDPTSTSEEEVMTLSDENISNVDFIAEKTTRISTVTVKYEEGAGILTGIEQISSDLEAAPVYYNLQGVRVANPEKGIYIVVKGSKSSKVLF